MRCFECVESPYWVSAPSGSAISVRLSRESTVNVETRPAARGNEKTETAAFSRAVRPKATTARLVDPGPANPFLGSMQIVGLARLLGEPLGRRGCLGRYRDRIRAVPVGGGRYAAHGRSRLLDDRASFWLKASSCGDNEEGCIRRAEERDRLPPGRCRPAGYNLLHFRDRSRRGRGHLQPRQGAPEAGTIRSPSIAAGIADSTGNPLSRHLLRILPRKRERPPRRGLPWPRSWRCRGRSLIRYPIQNGYAKPAAFAQLREPRR